MDECSVKCIDAGYRKLIVRQLLTASINNNNINSNSNINHNHINNNSKINNNDNSNNSKNIANNS